MNVLSIILLAVCGSAAAASSPWRLLAPADPIQIFGGGQRTINLIWSNASGTTQLADFHVRIYLASSATAAPWSQTPWKPVTILPHQTIVETATAPFPDVAVETRFLLQWLDAPNRVAATSEVWVYPLNLLEMLKALGGEKPIGTLDPERLLAPLLAQAHVQNQNLGERELDSFDGHLVILGFFSAPSDAPDGLSERVTKLAKKGVAVVWIEPAQKRPSELHPDFYRLALGRGAVVVARANLVMPLGASPAAQLNLVHLAETAIRPEFESLPGARRNPLNL